MLHAVVVVLCNCYSFRTLDLLEKATREHVNVHQRVILGFECRMHVECRLEYAIYPSSLVSESRIYSIVHFVTGVLPNHTEEQN